MKKASKVLYVIAIVLNCLNFFVCIGMFCGAYIMKRFPNTVAKYAAEYGIKELNTVAKVLNMVTPVIIAGIVALAFSIVLLVFGVRALKALNRNESRVAPHVVVIVLSALDGEIFYLLASIFGAVNVSRTKQQALPPQQTPPAEENKPE